MGIGRHESREDLKTFAQLRMGVRVDRPGNQDWDYHTVGAKIGIRRADTGKPKITESTKEIETLLSRRQYLYDAAFLVALQGSAPVIEACAEALENPMWPIFLGRKSCVPSEPVFAGLGTFDSLATALSSVLWRPRINASDRDDWSRTRTLETYFEHIPGSPPPAEARLVYDVPRAFGFNSHDPRWVVPGQVTVDIGEETQKRPISKRRDPYGSGWSELRLARLEHDYHLCVFCKSPAEEVHHVDYQDVRVETLRSLCKICHDACTMLEYSRNMGRRRIDPSEPAQRSEIIEQINRLVTGRRSGRRRELLETGRADRE
jgi:5-methylcytosine-specific restriction endonuclease McrA